jgi:hypothetical protein
VAQNGRVLQKGRLSVRELKRELAQARSVLGSLADARRALESTITLK